MWPVSRDAANVDGDETKTAFDDSVTSSVGQAVAGDEAGRLTGPSFNYDGQQDYACCNT